MNNIENNNIANNTGNSIAIIACLKCEELYVKEWIDWHIKCGVDHFYLCDNFQTIAFLTSRQGFLKIHLLIYNKLHSINQDIFPIVCTKEIYLIYFLPSDPDNRSDSHA